MSESETEEDLNEKVEELENRVERLDERTAGTNRIEMRAYDLSVSMRSEESGMEKLAQIASCEMDSLMTKALVGEYQEIEEEDLFSIILGGD
jgi:hypothetical protein